MRVQYIPLTHDHQLKLVCSTQQYANKFSLTCHTLMPNTIKKQVWFVHCCDFVYVAVEKIDGDYL